MMLKKVANFEVDVEEGWKTKKDMEKTYGREKERSVIL